MGRDISIIMPAIRTHLWKGVYESIERSFHGSWEVIFVGPNHCPLELMSRGNVKYVKSFASPLVCRQISLLEAEGDYICYAADDVIFYPNSLDEAWLTLCKSKDPMELVVGKYSEGTDNPQSDMAATDLYWHLNHHGFLQPICALFPERDMLLINTGLIPRKLLIDIGGWDCQFEACAMGCVDLSMRLQLYGAKCIIQANPIFYSSHFVADAGDHGPIHDGQTDHDMPLFLQIWARPEAQGRTVIELANHLHYPTVWSRRFN